MATIYDVAKVAEVSPKTVSRVINGDAPVGKETRERVERAIAELGYVPSNAARMMRSTKSRLIGLITGAISNTPESNEPTGLPDLYIVQGIQKVMADAGMTVMIADTMGDTRKAPDLIRTFLQHKVEGIIYVADFHKRIDLDLRGTDGPIVLANCYDDKGTRSVLPDDRKCQMALVDRLIAHGHRRIGYLSLDPAMDASRLRIEGYRDALAARQVPFDPALVMQGFDAGPVHRAEVLRQSLEAMLTLDNPPTVICCGNDEMALRLYGLLRTRGIRVPEEVSVAGFDNYRAIAETLFPPLTTVELPYAGMGRRAAETLLQMIGDAAGAPPATDPILISGPVVWRSSVTDRTAERPEPKGGIQ